ncbi:MAG: hypothetical protein RL120_12325 [Gammaproteobacteria bacterium]
MCGICARFLDSGEYCEKCARVAEAQQHFSEEQERKVKKRAAADRAALHQVDPEEEERERRKRSDRKYIWAGIVGSTIMMFGSMAVYAFPNMLEDPLAREARLTEMSFEECRQIFEDIGYRLKAGEAPDPTVRCPGTAVPNLVTRSGGLIRVSHPNPAQFGLAALYVNSDSHQVFYEGY